METRRLKTSESCKTVWNLAKDASNINEHGMVVPRLVSIKDPSTNPKEAPETCFRADPTEAHSRASSVDLSGASQPLPDRCG
ncbi:hypothetical protein B296_00027285 [Ensete ventricosum]|uniref:Uncharacterized protein n=1 Tax=Ensete ventricosum TaxID=4639 RepID=A0A426ZTV4_ENSVE|nr:hypothetical protein B296_00027285 [Ensete ventricosum]